MSTPSPAPFNVFIDSDGPVADFEKALLLDGRPPETFKHSPGAYLWLDITPGASWGINALKVLDDEDELRVWILTKTPSSCPYAYTEKVLWYRRHFPWLEDRVILTHDKSIMGGPEDFLFDDRPHKANVEHFKGEFVYFDPLHPPDLEWSFFVDLVYAKARANRGLALGGGYTK